MQMLSASPDPTTGILASLPAILAVMAFVIYQIILSHRTADEITKNIVDKLRAQSPQADRLEGLPAAKVVELLKGDQELKAKLDKGDSRILLKIAEQEHKKSLFVYRLIGFLFVVGIAAFVYVKTRPQPITMTAWNMRSLHPDSKGLPVDMDDLEVTWTAGGDGQDCVFFMENPQNGKRSIEVKTSSNEQRVVFRPEQYQQALEERHKGKTNRFRVKARSAASSYTSQEFEVQVGIAILILPVEEDKEVWVSALVDNTSIDHYSFRGKLLVDLKERPIVPVSFGDDFRNPKTSFPVPNYSEINWSTARFAYFGPDDPRVIRRMPTHL